MNPGIALLVAAGGVSVGVIGAVFAWAARNRYRGGLAEHRRAEMAWRGAKRDHAAAVLERQIAVALRDDAARMLKPSDSFPEEWDK